MTRMTNAYYNTGYEQGQANVKRNLEEAIAEIKRKAIINREDDRTDIATGMMMAVEIIKEHTDGRTL